MRNELTPENLLAAYAVGIFPMADEEGAVHWLAPDPRAVLELDHLRVSRSLRTVVQRGVFETSVNRAFEDVMDHCADRADGTWISREIREAYIRLHRLGYAHSIETWKDGQLAGGLYGVALGGAFFGESMFHRVSNASKVALVELVSRMRSRCFVLLDVQFLTDSLRRFGAVEIPRTDYETRLEHAVRRACSFVDEADG